MVWIYPLCLRCACSHYTKQAQYQHPCASLTQYQFGNRGTQLPITAQSQPQGNLVPANPYLNTGHTQAFF